MNETPQQPQQSAGDHTQLPPHEQANQARRHRSVVKLVAAVVLVALCFLAGYAGSTVGRNGTAVTGFDRVKNDGNLVVTQNEQDISSLVKKVSPSVVSIITTVKASGFSNQTAQAAGTGMVVSKDGYIMTNKHVVDGAPDATVVMADGKSFKSVKIVGSDPLNDVAFLKISGVKDLTPVELGDSKTVRTGQQVVAIGNALGEYQNTVTTGIISGLGRPLVAATDDSGTNSEQLSDLLQTDAAINHGNSGGPLLNTSGQVIGINTAIAQDAQSIGFAIPIGATKGMIRHLVNTGKLERAVIGLQYVSITPEVKATYNLPVDQGDYVPADSGRAVLKSSPAAKAGIKEKDIITSVNGEKVGSGKSISTLIGEFQPGDSVTMTVLRDGKSIDLKVTLEAYDR